jgi:hypothetical protein
MTKSSANISQRNALAANGRCVLFGLAGFCAFVFFTNLPITLLVCHSRGKSAAPD